MDYPNLPYLVDGDVKMSESLAMMKYIARKGKLTPASEEEQINLDVAEGAVVDFHMAFTPMCYNSDFENLKGPFLEKLPLNGAIASWGGINEEDPNCGDGSAAAKSCCS